MSPDFPKADDRLCVNPRNRRCVHLLGQFRLTDAHGRRPVPQGQAQQLLAYLLLHPQALHSRDELAELLGN